jgi:hypothetical protein
MPCTFSALGARWTVWPIAPGLNDDLRAGHELGGTTGLYFRTSDGEERLLPLSAGDLDALGDLTTRPNQELAQLAQRAKPLH